MKLERATKNLGFTIIELLIVIVVIAILATISIVAYGGIQNRANDSTIKSDMAGIVKAIRLYEAEKGELPKGGSATGNSAGFPGISFRVSKGSYDTTASNLYYCQGAKSGEQTFTVAARSKSLNVFVYSPEGGVTLASSGSAYSNCVAGWDSATYSLSYGYYVTNNSWWSWTNG
jgi:general secretion pathway protein G